MGLSDFSFLDQHGFDMFLLKLEVYVVGNSSSSRIATPRPLDDLYWKDMGLCNNSDYTRLFVTSFVMVAVVSPVFNDVGSIDHTFTLLLAYGLLLCFTITLVIIPQLDR